MKRLLLLMLLLTTAASAADFMVVYQIKNATNESQLFHGLPYVIQWCTDKEMTHCRIDNELLPINDVADVFGASSAEYVFYFNLEPGTATRTIYFQAFQVGSGQVLEAPRIANSSIDAITLRRYELTNCSFAYSLNWEACKTIRRNVFFNSAEEQTDDLDLHPEDLFPACSSSNSGKDLDTVRCACEFLVPNLHIGTIFNLLVKSLESLFSVSSLLGAVIELSPGGTIDYFVDIFWPLFLALFLLVFEYLKDYVMFAAAYLSWMAFISEASNRDLMKNNPGGLAAFTCIAILIGSLWLLGADAGLWEPLVVF
jgi:hypothetical protein